MELRLQLPEASLIRSRWGWVGARKGKWYKLGPGWVDVGDNGGE